MARVAVVLAGCGYLDGAEIRESVLSLLYLDQLGAKVHFQRRNLSRHHRTGHPELLGHGRKTVQLGHPNK